MPPPDLIDLTADHVKTVLSGDGTGHDWWHVYRAWKMSRRVGQAEKADLLIVELAAWARAGICLRFRAGGSPRYLSVLR
ncbi:MAG: hypothetical protein ABSF26_31065 [Thermoguttaceae bacterium]|jgi:uncharacterized protein